MIGVSRTVRIGVVATVGFTAGCGAVPDERQVDAVLPFVVRVNDVDLSRAVASRAGAAGAATPPVFRDPHGLRRSLTDSLREAGLFTRIVDGDDAELPVDLEMDIAIRGEDFGPGSPTIGGALFSTVVWLFVGHISWFIENREYPQSNVILSVVFRRPEEDAAAGDDAADPVLFSENLLLKGLGLSFLERADTESWLFNILLPPWWGDGNARVAGASLVGKAVEFFSAQAPDRILSRFPARYHEELASFLVHVPERDEALIVARQPIRNITISAAGGGSRSFHPEEEDMQIRGAEREAAVLYLSQREINIGVSPHDRFYRLPLLDEERGHVRISAILERGTPHWTIYRSRRGGLAPGSP